MYTINDIKVTLLNPEAVSHFIENHGIIACVCYDTNEKYAERVGLSCLKEGHTSGSRGDYFKFEIECPRFTADQIMRHEQGIFKNCQSQRYVAMDNNFSIYVPPQCMNNPKLYAQYEMFEESCKVYYSNLRLQLDNEGITGEKANDLMRTMLPIGVKCKLRIGFTIEALIHFMEKRLCNRADLPIRKVAQLMKEEILKVEPRYKDLLVPQCKKLMYCPERHSCGAMEGKDFVQSAILFYNEYLRLENEEAQE